MSLLLFKSFEALAPTYSSLTLIGSASKTDVGTVPTSFNVLAGDTLVAVITNFGSSGTVTVTGGGQTWTVLAEQGSAQSTITFAHVLNASAVSSPTLTVGVTTQNFPSVVIHHFRGTQPVNLVSGSPSAGSGNGSTLTTGPLTSLGDATFLAGFACFTDATKSSNTIAGQTGTLYESSANTGYTSTVLKNLTGAQTGITGVQVQGLGDNWVGGLIGLQSVGSVTPPGPPGGVSATNSVLTNTITWSPVSGATSYNIYWATSAGVTQYTGTKIAGASSPYLHTGRTDGLTYYYVVTAENSAGESADSSEVSVYVPPISHQAILQATRISGVAPLAVRFDSLQSTSPTTAFPFEGLRHTWDFGDTGAGTWASGARAGTQSKNQEEGPLASHIFETPGTFTVTLTTYNGSSTSTDTATITVSDPATVYSGSATICVSSTALPVAGVGGVPTGAQCFLETTVVGALSHLTGANQRLLLKRGDTFNADGETQLSNTAWTGITVGAYGSGNKPRLLFTGAYPTNNGVFGVYSPDFRIIDLKFDNTNTGTYSVRGANILATATNCLMLRVDGINGTSILGYTSANESFFIDCTLISPAGGGGNFGIYSALSSGLTINGCVMGDAGAIENTVRNQGTSNSVFCHNHLYKSSATKHHYSIRGYDSAHWTENHVVSDNQFGGLGAYSGPGDLQLAPQNTSSNEPIRNILVERNYFAGDSADVFPSQISVETISGVVIRNNLCLLGTGAIIASNFVSASHSNTAGLGPITDLKIYNNSVYSGSPNFSLAQVWENTAGAPTGIALTNNLCYAPNATRDATWSGTAPTLEVHSAGVGITLLTNSSDAQIKNTAPGWTTQPPASLADFAILTGSYAKNSGTAVTLWTDFFGNTRDGSYDIGASEYVASITGSGAINTKKTTVAVSGSVTSANTTGTISVSTKKVSTAIVGTERFSSSITPATKKTSVSLVASERFSNVISASTKKASSVITATERFSGTLAPSTKKAASNVSANEVFSGSLVVVSKKSTVTFSGISIDGTSVTINANTKKTTASIISSEIFSGSISGGTKKSSSSLNATQRFSGSIASSTKKASSSLIATQRFLGTLTPSTKKTTVNLAGISASGPTASISANTKKVVSSISGSEIFSSSIVAGTKKATTSITAIEKFVATIASSTKKAISSILGSSFMSLVVGVNTKKATSIISAIERFNSSIVGVTKKPATSITATERFSGTISSQSKKATASVSGGILTIANISSSTKKTSTIIVGSEIFTATVVVVNKKSVAHVAGTEKYSGSIPAQTKKPVVDFNALVLKDVTYRTFYDRVKMTDIVPMYPKGHLEVIAKVVKGISLGNSYSRVGNITTSVSVTDTMTAIKNRPAQSISHTLSEAVHLTDSARIPLKRNITTTVVVSDNLFSGELPVPPAEGKNNSYLLTTKVRVKDKVVRGKSILIGSSIRTNDSIAVSKNGVDTTGKNIHITLQESVVLND